MSNVSLIHEASSPVPLASHILRELQFKREVLQIFIILGFVNVMPDIAKEQ
jgi:hypothetical protein